MLLLVGLCLLHAVLAAVAATSPTAAPTPSTIVDILSAHAEYSYFVRHVQRLGAIPRINSMRNVTVFAPVNLAFVDLDAAQNDTAESVLRYFAPQRFRVGYMDDRDVVLDLLYVPKKHRSFPLKVGPHGLGAAREYRVNDVAEIVDYDRFAKHQNSFVQTIDHLLPERVLLCDVVAAPGVAVNGHAVLFVQRLFALALERTHTLCEALTANISTVLLPTDAYVNASLTPLERAYYLALARGQADVLLRPTKEAANEMAADIAQLLQTLLLPDLVGGVNGTRGSHRSAWGTHRYTFGLANTSQLVVNNHLRSAAGLTALVARDGLIHLFDAAPAQPASFFAALGVAPAEMVPRRALYANHYSRLVREMKFRKLAKYIDGSTRNQTILIDGSDRDDVPEDDDMVGASFSNRQQMQYRFMDGAVDVGRHLSPAQPVYHALLASNLCLKKRIGSCYRVKVTGTLDDGVQNVYFNDDVAATDLILAAGNNAIYVADQDFVAPSSFKHVMVEMISEGVVKRHLDHIRIDKEACLQTMKYLNKFDLVLLADNKKGYTIFLPCGYTIWDGDQGSTVQNFGSWDSLGLTLNYLEANPKVFKKIMKGLLLEGLVYSDFGLEDEQELHKLMKTLAGDYVNVSETFHSGDYNHVISLNETQVSIPLNSDILFNQGIVHITSKVLLPSDFRLSLLDLIGATNDESYLDYSYIHLLKNFPQLRKALKLDDAEDSEYSLLVPSPELLRSFNITKDYNRLWDFLQLHLISNADADVLRQCILANRPPYFNRGNASYVIHTNHTNGVFECHTSLLNGKTYLLLASHDTFFSSLGYNADRRVRISNYGCTNPASGNSSCVFLIEKPFSLSWFDLPDNFLHVHIGWISVGIGIIIGVILFGFCTTTVVLCLSGTGKKRKAAPLRTPESLFPPTESSYMRLTSDDDVNSGYYDYGYETDDDMTRHERDRLLPMKGAKKKQHSHSYGLSSPIGAPSAPRSIKGPGLKSAFTRDRHLPPLNI